MSRLSTRPRFRRSAARRCRTKSVAAITSEMGSLGLTPKSSLVTRCPAPSAARAPSARPIANHNERLAYDEPHDVDPRRAGGDADADLVRPASHAEDLSLDDHRSSQHVHATDEADLAGAFRR